MGGTGGEGPKDNGNFLGEKRQNDTHASTNDPEARLCKKSQVQEAKLSYHGHIMIENRNGLIRDVMATQADGQAETDAALMMGSSWRRGGKCVMLGADKAYDRMGFVRMVRELGVTPPVAQKNKTRKSTIDRRTTRHEVYRMSLSKGWLVDKAFGWMKQTGGLKKVKLRGLDKVGWLVTYTAAATTCFGSKPCSSNGLKRRKWGKSLL